MTWKIFRLLELFIRIPTLCDATWSDLLSWSSKFTRASADAASKRSHSPQPATLAVSGYGECSGMPMFHFTFTVRCREKRQLAVCVRMPLYSNNIAVLSCGNVEFILSSYRLNLRCYSIQTEMMYVMFSFFFFFADRIKYWSEHHKWNLKMAAVRTFWAHPIYRQKTAEMRL
jgi:hypothetical protein